MTDTIQKELARLQRYDEELTKVINPDFKDWHQNSKECRPELAAWVITNLREQLDWAHKEIERLYEEVKETREQYEEVKETREQYEEVKETREQVEFPYLNAFMRK